jgi:hypothetical protein
MANGNGLRQHQEMARGGEAKGHQSFGCDSLASVNGGKEHPDRNNGHAPMGDGERAGPPHIGRGGGSMPATAHSDHGPHMHIPV